MSSDELREWAAAHARTVGRTGLLTEAVSWDEENATPPPSGTPTVTTTLRSTLTSRTGSVWSVAWARHADDALLLATGSGSRTAAVWDPTTGTRLATLADHHTTPASRIGTVWSVAWARQADGTLLLATGSGDRTAAIWDPATGTQLALEGRHTDPVYSVAWARQADGTLLLATGSGDRTAAIWDATTGTRLTTLTGHTYTVGSVAWARQADGSLLLATGSGDGTAAVWDPATGTRQATLEGHTETVRSVAWAYHADGTLLLATGSGDRTAAVWDATTGTRLTTLTGHTGTVLSVAWARQADGTLLLATGSYDDTAGVWDPATGTRLAAINHPADVNAVALASGPDGKLLLATGCDDGNARIFDIDVEPAPRPGQSSSRRGARVGAGSAGQRPERAYGRRTATPAPTAGPDRRDGSPPTWDWDPSFAGATSPLPGLEASARAGLQHAASPPRTASPPPDPPLTVEDFRISLPPSVSAAWARQADGTLLLATGSSDSTVAIWDPTTGTRLATLTGHTGAVWSVAWARQADGTLLLATGSGDRTAAIWDVATGTRLATLTGHTSPVRSVAWAQQTDGTLLLATGSDDRTAAIWDPATESHLTALPDNSGLVRSVAWVRQADGTLLLATGGTNGTAVSDLATGSRVATLSSHHDDWVWSLAWAKWVNNTLVLATSSCNGTAAVWNLETATRVASLSGHTGPVTSVAWARQPSGNLLLATGSHDHTVAIWDLTTGTRLTTLTGHTGAVWSVAWVQAPDGALLLAVGSSGSTTVHRVTSPSQPEAAPARPSRPSRTLAHAAHGIVALGKADLWPPLSLVRDVVTITGPAVTSPTGDAAAALDSDAGPESSEDTVDPTVRALADHPGVRLLRGLAWPPAARVGFAALLAADLPDDPAFRAPPGTSAAEREQALLAALASPSAPPTRVPLDGLRAVADRFDTRTIALLRVLGPDAVAADPALPVRLRHRAPAMPPLDGAYVSLLTDIGATAREIARTDTGSAVHAPGSAGISRHGNPTRLLPTQLALPNDLMTLAYLRGDLLYRLHSAEPDIPPQPVTLVLDTTPATFGVVETVLKTVAHAATAALWQAGHHPTLICLDRPRLALTVTGPADLALMWTSRTLDPPDLDAALRTAAGTLAPVTAILTQYHLAREHPLAATADLRVVTTHVPGDEPPPSHARGSYHLHLPPHPTAQDITAVLRSLLYPSPAPPPASPPPNRSMPPRHA